MRLKHLKIHNFRSIKDLEMECLPLVTIIGPNNHGKSNILKALDFALSTSGKPAIDDLFAHAEDQTLWVEMTFHELTEQEKNTFKRYLLSDGSICIRKTAVFGENGVNISYNGYVERPSEEWLHADKAGQFTSRDKVPQPLQEFIPPSGRLSKTDIQKAQAAYIETHQDELEFVRELEDGPLFGQKNVAAGILPDLYLVPAVSELTDEIKVKSTTTFGKLLNRVIAEMANHDEQFKNIRNQIDTAIQTLNKNKGALGVLEENIQKELDGWNATVAIEVQPLDLDKIFSLGTNIRVDDGVDTLAQHKGHGLQRALLVAIVRAWANSLKQAETTAEMDEKLARRKRSNSLFFAIEEPEIFLHPHAQRILAKSLRQIAEEAGHQVFVCTHSTHFVDLDHYKEIVIVQKDAPISGSVAKQCTQDLFEGSDLQDRKHRFHMAEWINPERAELFFARKVVFVEGETEKVILPYLAQKLGTPCDDVTIVNCGSKHNLPLYIQLANAFSIQYAVIHDEDPLPDPIPDEWPDEKKKSKQRTFALNAEIQEMVDQSIGKVFMVAPDFEKMAGISKKQSAKKGKALAALDYFSDKSPEDIPETLRAIIDWMTQ